MHEDIVLTPMMKQFLDLKAKHPDAVMLFRCGDFYETYSTDAVVASEILGITLTKRANGKGKTIEMAGFPHHALDTYLPKLIRAGKRVAICDQLEDPKLTKKLVKRGITELVTPGASINDNVLNYRENNFLAAVHFGKGACGVAFLDISTGEFLTAEGPFDYVDKLLNNFAPKEVLFERGKRLMFEGNFGSKFFTFELDDWVFTETSAREKLLKHFEVKNLKGFGVEHLKNGIIASGAILQYLIMTQHTQIGHVTSLARIEENKYVRLDKFTVRSLELMGSMNDGGSSLLNVIDKTISPMGGRLLKRWLVFPLKDVQPINERLNVVEYFFRQPDFKELIEEQLHLIGDLERIISKVAVGRVSPREVVALKVALQAIEPIKAACMDADNASLNHIGEQLNICQSIRDRIDREIDNDPPLLINKGGVIKSGVSAGNMVYAWSARLGMLAGACAGFLLYDLYGFRTVVYAAVAVGVLGMYFASRVYVAFRAPIGLRLCSLDRFLLPRAWVPALNMLLIAFVPGVLLPLLYIGDYIAFLALAALVFLTLPFTKMFVKLSHHCQRGTGNTTCHLVMETGLLAGLATACRLADAFLLYHAAGVAAILALFFFVLLTYPYYKRKRVR